MRLGNVGYGQFERDGLARDDVGHDRSSLIPRSRRYRAKITQAGQ